MDDEYKEEIETYEFIIRYNNQKLIDFLGNEIIVCDNLSRIDVPQYYGKKINYDQINKLFFDSIKTLNKDTIDYFKEEVPKIKKERTNFFENGEAQLVGNSKKQEVHLTANDFKEIDLVAFSHEMGHIPTLKRGCLNDYYEYQEVLSIFLEYLSWVKIDKENAKKLFVNQRLNVSSEESNNVLNFYFDLEPEGEYREKLCEYRIRDAYKYILSFEYALKLVDLYEKDREYLTKLINDYLFNFKPFNELERTFDSDIRECKNILDLCKKYK